MTDDTRARAKIIEALKKKTSILMIKPDGQRRQRQQKLKKFEKRIFACTIFISQKEVNSEKMSLSSMLMSMMMLRMIAC